MAYAKTIALIAELGITPEDVADILESYTDELEATEPYATRSIDAVRSMASTFLFLDCQPEGSAK